MHDVSERAWEDCPVHFIDNVMVISVHTGLFSISMSKMLKVQLALLCIWCHNLKSINVMSSVGKGKNLFIKTDLLHFCSNCFKDTAETVGQHYLCHHCCPVGLTFPAIKVKQGETNHKCTLFQVIKLQCQHTFTLERQNIFVAPTRGNLDLLQCFQHNLQQTSRESYSSLRVSISII